MKILLVDDDLVLLTAIENHLIKEGHEVFTADDGVKALEIIEKKKVDVLISDIMMPNMSGLGLLNLLKQFYLNKIPVILISSLDKGDVILSALGLGASDFIVKPVNMEELTLRLRLLENKQNRNQT